jgi:hypothetical protein
MGAHMVTEHQHEQAERLEVTLQDADVRHQQQQKSEATTMHQHAQAHAGDTVGGRFGALGTPYVVGSTPTPATAYPAASAAHQTELPPDEPPLGFKIDET